MFTKYFSLKVKILITLFLNRKITLKKIFNVIYSSIAYRFKLTNSSKYPVVINMELSNKCNERCVFCRDEKGNIFDLNPNKENPSEFIQKGRMDFDIFSKIVNEVKDHSLLIIPYVNGEPFIYKHIDKVLKLLKQNRSGSILSTNGILLNNKNIDLVLEENLDQIKIHVSGYTNPIHQIEHLMGDVEEIKKNLINLSNKIKEKKSRIIVMIDYILYDHNKHELELFKKFAKDLNFNFSIRPGNPFQLKEKKGYTESKQPEINASEIACEWLWKVLTVNWNGDLLPCCDYVVWSKTHGYGTVITELNDLNRNKKIVPDIKSIWNGDKIIEMRTTHSKSGRKTIPICSGCNRVGVEYKY
jgi:MoaA/NifB/PqqE/SkfB family radical SAM enzyme